MAAGRLCYLVIEDFPLTERAYGICDCGDPVRIHARKRGIIDTILFGKPKVIRRFPRTVVPGTGEITFCPTQSYAMKTRKTSMQRREKHMTKAYPHIVAGYGQKSSRTLLSSPSPVLSRGRSVEDLWSSEALAAGDKKDKKDKEPKLECQFCHKETNSLSRCPECKETGCEDCLIYYASTTHKCPFCKNTLSIAGIEQAPKAAAGEKVKGKDQESDNEQNEENNAEERYNEAKFFESKNWFQERRTMQRDIERLEETVRGHSAAEARFKSRKDELEQALVQSQEESAKLRNEMSKWRDKIEGIKKNKKELTSENKKLKHKVDSLKKMVKGYKEEEKNFQRMREEWEKTVVSVKEQIRIGSEEREAEKSKHEEQVDRLEKRIKDMLNSSSSQEVSSKVTKEVEKEKVSVAVKRRLAMSDGDMENVRELFKGIDTDEDGQIDRDDFNKALGELTDARRTLVDRVFGYLDSHKKGRISFIEFSSRLNQFAKEFAGLPNFSSLEDFLASVIAAMDEKDSKGVEGGKAVTGDTEKSSEIEKHESSGSSYGTSSSSSSSSSSHGGEKEP